MKKIKEYPELQQEGYISVERNLPIGTTKGVFGIQVVSDGRVWVCVDGIAYLRFRPYLKSYGDKNDRQDG